MCSKSESGFWFPFEKFRGWCFQILLRTRKQCPAGSIQNCVHPWRLGKVEKLFQQNFIEFCIRGRMNTKWRIYNLTNLNINAALLKDVPMGCKNTVLPKPQLKIHTSNSLTFGKNTRQPYNDNLCFFVLLLSTCTKNNDWKKKLRNYSTYSSIKWMESAPIISKEPIWTLFLLLNVPNSEHCAVWYR